MLVKSCMKLPVLIFLLLTGCVNQTSCFFCSDKDILEFVNIKEKSLLSNSRQSVLKINTRTHIILTDKASGSFVSKFTANTTGSGFVYKQTEHGTIVITAHHVCHDDPTPKELEEMAGVYKVEHLSNTVVNTHVLYDHEGRRYKALELFSNKLMDVCALISSKIKKPEMPIALNPPEYFDTAFSLGYPSGLWGLNHTPAFKGKYLGMLDYVILLRPTASYSIPVSPGISGGPIINLDGNIIGMVHSYFLTAPNITLSITHEHLLKFVDNVLTEYTKNKGAYDELSLSFSSTVSSCFPGSEI